MSWTYTDYYQNDLWTQFHFFKTNSNNGAVDEYIAPGKRWKLAEIRFYTTSSFRSNEYLFVNVSSARGSSFGASLLSYLFSGSTGYRYDLWSTPLQFASDDQVRVRLTTASAVHIVGIEAIGWMVAS